MPFNKSSITIFVILFSLLSLSACDRGGDTEVSELEGHWLEEDQYNQLVDIQEGQSTCEDLRSGDHFSTYEDGISVDLESISGNGRVYRMANIRKDDDATNNNGLVVSENNSIVRRPGIPGYFFDYGVIGDAGKFSYSSNYQNVLRENEIEITDPNRVYSKSEDNLMDVAVTIELSPESQELLGEDATTVTTSYVKVNQQEVQQLFATAQSCIE